MPRHKKTTKQLAGSLMYFVAVAAPLTTAPQLIQIFDTGVATGLSVSTWILYALFGIVPFWYAISNHLKPLIVSNALWLTIDFLMIYAILRYSPDMVPSSFDKLLLINNIGKTLSGLSLFLLSIACALFATDLRMQTKLHKRVNA